MKNMLEMAKVISGYSKKEVLRRYEICRNRYTDDNTEYKKFDLVAEASMLLQRIVDLAKEEISAEQVMDAVTEIAWVIPPKGDNQDFWLNKYGNRHWNLTDGTKSAIRSYYWCDRVIILNATRRVLEDIKFSEFIHRIDAEGWEPEIPEVKIDFNKDKE